MLPLLAAIAMLTGPAIAWATPPRAGPEPLVLDDEADAGGFGEPLDAAEGDLDASEAAGAGEARSTSETNQPLSGAEPPANSGSLDEAANTPGGPVSTPPGGARTDRESAPIGAGDAGAASAKGKTGNALQSIVGTLGLVILLMVAGQLWHRSRRGRKSGSAQNDDTLITLRAAGLVGLPGTGAAAPPARQPAPQSNDARAERSLRTLIQQARHVTDQCLADLEASADRLEKLIAAADDRLMRLERAGAARAGEFTGVIGRVATGGSTGGSAGAMPAAGSNGAAALRAEMGVDGDREGAPLRMAGGAPMDVDTLTRRVHELSDAGHSAVEIAKRLEEHVGKVELILALRGVER